MSDPKDQTTIVPHSQQPLVTRTYPSIEELEKVVLSSADAQKQWAKVPLSTRLTIANKFVVSAVVCLPPPAVPNVLYRFQGRVQQDVGRNPGGVDPTDGEARPTQCSTTVVSNSLSFQARVPGPGRGAGVFGSRTIHDIHRGILPCGCFSQRHR